MATISMSCNFLLGVEPGLVIARARIDRIGAAVGSTSMTLHAGDKLLATAQGAYRLFRE
jgi:acyl-coenzyme A thioesterase PaaI-like protein